MSKGLRGFVDDALSRTGSLAVEKSGDFPTARPFAHKLHRALFVSYKIPEGQHQPQHRSVDRKWQGSTYPRAFSVRTNGATSALLEKLATLRPTLPITVVLDNARYQRCALVKTCAEKLKIELLFLPTYSPNLNLIERLWKFVKQQCLYAKYYPGFHFFTTAIERCLQDTHTIYANPLQSLLTLNFQTFQKIPS